jgi:hypothetical protein
MDHDRMPRPQGTGEQNESLRGTCREQHLAVGTSMTSGDDATGRSGIRIVSDLIQCCLQRGVQPGRARRMPHVDGEIDEAGAQILVAVVLQIY